MRSSSRPCPVNAETITGLPNDDLRAGAPRGKRCFIQEIAFVPDLHEAAIIGGINPETGQDGIDVGTLRFGVFMRDIADMQNDVRFKYFLKSRPEGLDKHGWQVRNKSDGIGENNSPAMRQRDTAQGRIEGREKHVFGRDPGLRKPIEQCGFSCVRVTDQRDNWSKARRGGFDDVGHACA